MAEYIERGALLNKLKERDLCLCVTEWDIKEAPTADVAPIRHGCWVDRYGGKYDNQIYECSICRNKAPYRCEISLLGHGTWLQKLSDWCPACGAKMDGVR